MGYPDGTHGGVVAEEITMDLMKVDIYKYFKEYRTWLPSPAVIFVGSEESLKKKQKEELETNYTEEITTVFFSPKVLVTYTSAGQKLSEYNVMSKIHPEYVTEFTEEQKKEVLDEIKNLNLALLFLSCKNVTTEKIPAPIKLNKKRKKKGKPPIREYNIIRMTQSFSDESLKTGNKQKITRKISYRIGHFKTFSSEKPLFGKYSGRFWWSPLNKKEVGIKNIVKV